MVFLGQGAVVLDKPTFEGKRQREALSALQKESGRDATAVARDVHLSYPQYNRYLWGRVPLRTDQIRSFAAAYGVSPARLVEKLGLADDIPEIAPIAAGSAPWSFREALRGQIPESDIEAFAAEHEGKPIKDQQAAVAGILRAAARQRERTRSTA